MIISSEEAVYISMVIILFASIIYLWFSEVLSHENVSKNEGGKMKSGRKKEKTL